MKILIADKISSQGIALLQREPDFTVDVKPGLTTGELISGISPYDALIVRSATKVTAEVIEAADGLRVIGRAGTGIDNVDVEAATRRGIAVMNTPGGNSISVAEHTFALMLALARHIPGANASLKQGHWDKKSFLGAELRDKILGILGLGKVGVEVARRALAFRMRVLAYDPFVPERVAKDLGAVLVPLETLLENSDYVTLHLALTPETRHFIDSAKLALMKPEARLINCSRGEIVDEKALYSALAEKKIAAAALDVFETEPPSDRKLLELPNLICTPHLGASTAEAQESVGIEIAGQIRAFLKTGMAQNTVNLPALSMDEYHRLEPYLKLGERMGGFLAAISFRRLEEIGIRYYGDAARINTSFITNAVVQAILRPVCDRVNAINARAVAAERGITVVESHSSRPRAFPNLISIKLRCSSTNSPLSKTTSREEWVEGTVLLGPEGSTGPSAFRLASVDGIEMEAPLRGTLLFFRNEDTPGVIGHVGSTLGKAGINIGSFALGRDENTRAAVGLVNIDNGLPPKVLEELQAMPAIHFARVIKF